MGRRMGTPLTPEMKCFIGENSEGTTSKEMSRLLNEKFGAGTTVGQISQYRRRNGLRSGITGRFEKGHIPHNKGKKQRDFMSEESREKCRRTQFKKGQVPHNGGAPVGAVRARRGKDGRLHLWEKVAQPGVWRPHHLMVWERRNGSIPDGCMVCFADGDGTNCRIDNLFLETRAQHAVKNRYRMRGHGIEGQMAGNALADLTMAIRAKRKEIKRK